MAMFRDDPTKFVDVVWYAVDPQTSGVMPFGTAFASQVWELWEKVSPPVGEQFYPRPYWSGAAPAGLGLPGPNSLCGSADQWQRGALTSDPVPPVWAGSISPQCCPPPPIQSIGGDRHGGKYPADCGQGTVPFPSKVYAHFYGVTPNLCNSLAGKVLPMIYTPQGSVPCYADGPAYVAPPFAYNGTTIQFLAYCIGGYPYFQLQMWALTDPCVLNEAANSFNVPTVPGYWLWPNFPLFLIAGCSPVENYKIQMVI